MAKTIRIPLVGTFNPRGPLAAFASVVTTGKDQLFDNCIFELPKNPVTGSTNVYCEKKYWAETIIAHQGDYTNPTEIVASDFGTQSWTIGAVGISFNSNVLAAPAQTTMQRMGQASGVITHIVETIIGGVQTFLCTSSDGTGWFLAKDSITTNNTSINVGATFTANTSSGSAVLASVSSFAGRYVGQAITGTGIPADTRILSMDSGASTITMTANATANGTGITVTAERLAKIIDADFPTDIIGPFGCIGGWNFIMTESGRVQNSNLNSIVSWTAGDYVSTNFYPDTARAGVWVVGNRIAAISSSSFEWYYNAGNPSGSPLSPSTELNFNVGAISSRAVCKLEDRLFWVSAPTSGESAIFTLNGSAPQQISNEQLNSLVNSNPTLNTSTYTRFSLCAARIAGKKFLIFEGRYVLDIDVGIWSYWSGSPRIIRCTGISSKSSTPASTSGLLFFIDPVVDAFYSLKTESGVTATQSTMTIRTSRIDLGTGNLKSPEYYELDSDIQASGTATLEVSDDDYGTWVTIGTFDMTKMHPRIHRGKAWRGGRAHRLTHSANTPFRASTLTIKYSEGTH